MTKQIALVIDLDRCIGCLGGCRVACKLEHGIALGESRSRLFTIESGIYPNLEMYFLPVMCQQCENPACAAVCPTLACRKDESDGVIKIDRDRCIGCGSCKRACPYDALNLNREMLTMDKCDVCADLRENGDQPACVKNCAGKAIRFGDLNDAESEVSRLLRETKSEHIHKLPDEDNHPSTSFILRRGHWKEDVL